MNMTINSTRYIVPWKQDTTLAMFMDWGSRINLVFDFKDTNPVYEVVYDRFYENIILHKWDVVGTYYPSVSVIRVNSVTYTHTQLTHLTDENVIWSCLPSVLDHKCACHTRDKYSPVVNIYFHYLRYQ